MKISPILITVENQPYKLLFTCKTWKHKIDESNNITGYTFILAYLFHIWILCSLT